MARFGRRSLEHPIILPALPDSRRKAAGGNQCFASRMATTSGSLLIEDNTRVDGVAHLALRSFRMKGQLTSRATCNQKH